jgi:hypothetical protein
MKFTLKGTAAMQKKFSKIAKESPNEFLLAGLEEMKIERAEMQRRTPVDQGILRDSLTVEGANRRHTVSISVTTDVPYAPYVHENLEAFHEIGEAKFIESVLDESAPHLLKRIGRRIDLKKLAR